MYIYITGVLDKVPNTIFKKEKGFVEDHHTRFPGPTALLHRRVASLFCRTAALLSGLWDNFGTIHPGITVWERRRMKLGGVFVYLISTQTDIDT